MRFVDYYPSGFSLTEQKIGNVACYTANAGKADPSPDLCASVVLSLPDSPFTAIYQQSRSWMNVLFGEKFSELADLTEALLVRLGDSYLYLLALAGDRMKTAMRGSREGVEIRLFSGVSEESVKGEPFFLLSQGEDPVRLINETAAAACEFLGNGMKLRSERVYPEVLEKIGWCSWDAFQIRVSHPGLLEKAKEFADKKVPISFAIIDDMWADIPGHNGVPGLNELPADVEFGAMVSVMHKSPIRNFEGDPVRFPKGMKAAVSDLKKAGIPNVALWFPTAGYWAGLIPDSPAAKEQEGNTFVHPDGRILPLPTEDAAERYFDLFCRKAKGFGCDFVKIDDQGFHHNYRNLFPVGETSSAFQHAIDKAAFRYFGGALINCMGMPIECLYHRRESAVCRCSDDFIPENASWFIKNVLECAFSGILQGRFYYNDWDMWWTDDRQATKNSLCRAVSGGPIYVSDKLGRTRPEILRPVCFDDGRILRLDDSAMPTADCLIGDPTKSRSVFKIRNRAKDTGVIVALDLCADSSAVSGTVSAKDAGLPEGKYLWYEHFSGTAGVLSEGESLPVTLESADDFRHYQFLPYRSDKPVIIGRTDKFNSRVAVLSETEDSFTLYEGGECTVWSEKPISFFCGDEELSVAVVGENLFRIFPERGETVVTYLT